MTAEMLATTMTLNSYPSCCCLSSFSPQQVPLSITLNAFFPFAFINVNTSLLLHSITFFLFYLLTVRSTTPLKNIFLSFFQTCILLLSTFFQFFILCSFFSLFISFTSLHGIFGLFSLYILYFYEKRKHNEHSLAFFPALFNPCI